MRFIFFMLSSMTLPLVVANVMISVIANTFERLNPIKDILDMRVRCQLCLDLEFLSIGLKRIWYAICCCKKKPKKDVEEYFFACTYRHYEDPNENQDLMDGVDEKFRERHDEVVGSFEKKLEEMGVEMNREMEAAEKEYRQALEMLKVIGEKAGVSGV